MFMIRDILLAIMCAWGILGLVVESARYPRIVRVAFIPTLAVLLLAFVVDIVWPIRSLVTIAAALLSLTAVVVVVVSSSAGWPLSYVSFVRVGCTLMSISVCLLAALDLHFLPWSSHTVYLVVNVVGLVGVGVLAVAYLALRPKGRPWEVF